jgi:hypothetical protein
VLHPQNECGLCCILRSLYCRSLSAGFLPPFFISFSQLSTFCSPDPPIAPPSLTTSSVEVLRPPSPPPHHLDAYSVVGPAQRRRRSSPPGATCGGAEVELVISISDSISSVLSLSPFLAPCSSLETSTRCGAPPRPLLRRRRPARIRRQGDVLPTSMTSASICNRDCKESDAHSLKGEG